MAFRYLFGATLKGSVDDTDRIAIKDSTIASGNPDRNILVSILKAFFVNGIKAGTEQLNPRSFTSGRFDSQELPVTAIVTPGKYTIAQSEDIADNVASAMLRIVTDSGTDVIEVDFEESASAKTHQNTKIELLRSKIGKISLVKSDSVNGSGSKISIDISSATDIKVQLISNTGNNAGFTLVTPFLDNTPTLPDNVTVGTFLEAGEEYHISNDPSSLTFVSPRISAIAVNNDSIRVSVAWSGNPKQGTSILAALGANTKFIDPSGNFSASISGETYSNFNIIKKDVFFQIDQIGISTSLTKNVLISLRIQHNDDKLTIT